MNFNCLLKGDCLNVMDQMIKDDMNVDTVITSPPYFNAREYSYYESYDVYLDFLKDVFNRTRILMTNSSFLIVNVSPVIEARESRNTKSKRYPIPQDLTYMLTRSGFEFLDEIIWKKPDGAVKNRVGGFHRSRKPKTYKPNCVTESLLVFQRDDSGLIDKYLKNTSLVTGDYDRTNVWEINPETKSQHPAPFPITLVEKLIRYYSYEDDVVFDPFMGSGTTGVACKNLNRNFIGIELDETYFEIAKKRIEEA